MNIDKVTAVYFSPTKGTERYVIEIAKRLSASFECIDLTDLKTRFKEYSFTQSDLVIFGAPVYIGRLPQIEGGIFDRISGANTPAVFNVSYGNREFEDALLEEKDTCEKNGFVGIAAGAWIAPHTFSDQIAAGRPDVEDIKEVERFTDKIKELLQDGLDSKKQLEVSGQRPYRKIKALPFHPKGSRRCTSCGTCTSLCPAGAIPADNPRTTEKKKCIQCLACVKNCPENARGISNPIFKKAVSKLESDLTKTRKSSELFFIT